MEGRKSPADNETLEDACARYLTWEDSRISELFGGMLRSDVCCSVCCNQSTVYIPLMDIALPIPERDQRPFHLQYFSYNPSIHLTKCLKMLTTKETLYQGWPTFCTLRATFRYLKKSAGLTYPSAPNMFNIQYIKLWQGEQTFIVL